jgi:DNA-binding MarR family transcriptional regulator
VNAALEVMDTVEREEVRTLEILEAIDKRSDLTQRHLAQRLGVALGLTNSYLKRCVRKGLVKIQQAPANRYVYYLTPKGFAEKSRLTGDYLSSSFAFYRKASDSCASSLLAARESGHQRIVLCGDSELAEIALLRAQEHRLEVVAVLDPAGKGKSFLGIPVYEHLEDCPPFEVCLMTTLQDFDDMYRRLAAVMPEERILVPSILGLRVR